MSRRSKSPATAVAGPPPDALFAEMLRAARELLAVRSPLDAELMVSELLGTWWGQRAVAGASVEQLIGERLVEYAAGKRSPAALALLSGIACLGTSRQAARAERAAIVMMDAGVPCPAWSSHLGEVTPGECYVNPDEFGDQDEIICLFSYAGEERHAMVCVVDHNNGGMLRDGWVTSRTAKLLDHCREASARRRRAGDKRAEPGHGTGEPGNRAGEPGRPATDTEFREIEPALARRMLESALAATNAAAAAGPAPVAESFPSYHAFIRSRVRALPPYPGSYRRPVWTRDRRAMLAAEFLASDEAEDLSDPAAASHCVDRIIDYGCDRDGGRPLRMSPSKARAYLLGWLPRKVMLSFAEQDAMPHVLAAWVRWAGRRRQLPQAQIGQTLEAVFDSISAFSEAYRDPAEFGLDYALVRRLLPDGDLEALPRRAFAFPVLEGWHSGVDLSALNPALPEDRRALLTADHTTPAPGGVGRHIDRHLILADLLWRGDPPELWQTAQRLLDAGHERHVILHALMSLAERCAGNRRALLTALSTLTLDND